MMVNLGTPAVLGLQFPKTRSLRIHVRAVNPFMWIHEYLGFCELKSKNSWSAKIIPVQETLSGCASLYSQKNSAHVQDKSIRIMVICSLLGSLRVCLERHPPLVTFFFCLLSLAVACFGFSAYIQSHEVQNPDVKKDWNSLLKSLAHLMFCIPNKTHEDASTSLPSTTAAKSLTTVTVLVGLTFDLHNGTYPPNGTHLSLTVSGMELGVKGPDAQESIHLLAVSMNSVSHESCLSITAPSSFIPKNRQLPECVITETDMHLEELGICYQSHYQDNPALASMLDQVDRMLCSQRLLMTGTFLFCLCVMLCCSAGMCYPPPRDNWGKI